MSEFLFQKSQRVTVPVNLAGANAVQGIVTSDTGYLGREPDYVVKWPCADTVDENLNPVIREAQIPESILLQAQPPEMISIGEAEKAAEAARLSATAELGADLAALSADNERLRRNALRRQKASRKAKGSARVRKRR